MLDIVQIEGVKAKVHKAKFKFISVAVLAIAIFVMSGCDGTGKVTPGGAPDPNETAATVNGKPIKLEEVERAIKQQGQGQEDKLSPLELAQARLQVLDTLIQNEVLYQKAEKENTVPTEEEVTAEVNKKKTESGLSQEEFDKQMKAAGFDEASFRESAKKAIAGQKLIEKITGKIEPPKDNEIVSFYEGNKPAFVKKRGVKLAAIVVDPSDSGANDTTKNETDATLKVKEIQQKLQGANNANFSQIAAEMSEDPSRLQSGELGYLSEDDLKQNFPQLASGFMDARFAIGSVTQPLNIAGKLYIFKLQERNEKEENLTLESPGVRQQITQSLIDARKQLLSASYAAIAMNEAKIENFLARKVVENPNELSGSRPAVPANANANSNSNTTSNLVVNSNSNANTPSNSNAEANKSATIEKPANAANTNSK
jgi:peptidyl-prolyl cis-trans isomerase SurA